MKTLIEIEPGVDGLHALLDFDPEDGWIVGAQLHERVKQRSPVATWCADGFYSRLLMGGPYWCTDPDRREDDKTRRLIDKHGFGISQDGRGRFHAEAGDGCHCDLYPFTCPGYEARESALRRITQWAEDEAQR